MFPHAIRNISARSIRNLLLAAALGSAGLALSAADGPAARAGEAADLATKAEQLLAAGKGPEAYAAMRAATLAIWERMPFAVRRAVFVSKPAGGYGIFNPREPVFKPGEKLLVYMEPIGYGFKEAAKGVWGFQLTVDLEIATADGRILGGQKAFAKFPLTSRQKNMEFYMSLDLDLGNAPPGKYVLVLTVHDDVKRQSAKVELPFEFRQ